MARAHQPFSRRHSPSDHGPALLGPGAVRRGLSAAPGAVVAGRWRGALLPVVAGCSRPSEAWAAVAVRLRLLLGTTALAIVLIVVGLAFFALPGLVLALGFSFAGPVVLAEGSAGCGALERSWRLMRWAWRPQLVIVFVGALATVGIRWVLWRYWPVQSLPGRVAFSAMVCALTLPFATAASAILYVQT